MAGTCLRSHFLWLSSFPTISSHAPLTHLLSSHAAAGLPSCPGTSHAALVWPQAICKLPEAPCLIYKRGARVPASEDGGMKQDNAR